MSTKPFQIVNADGRRFSIRLLRKDERYGDDDALIYSNDEPSVEFFDASGFDSQETSDVFGYFTGIRCPVGELFLDNRPEAFDEHLLVWNISESNIASIQKWLLEQLNEDEKRLFKTVLPKKTKSKTRHAKSIKPHAAEPFVDITTFIPSSPSKEQPRSFDEIMDEIERHDSSPLYSEKRTPEPFSFLQQQLEVALQALDLAETAEINWTQDNINLRLHLLSAKKRILKTLALLQRA